MSTRGVKDVAAFLGVSRDCIYQASAPGGILPVRRIGAMLRFNPAEIRAWALKDDERVIAFRGRR